MNRDNKKKLILTGGGTAGHVMPNLALLPELDKAGWNYEYIGSRRGIERELVTGCMPYHGIFSGKLRRYFDFENFTDLFRVVLGIVQAYWILGRIKPQAIFSKGGFVGVPVVIGGWLRKIPIVLHEGDLTPGLANRISLRFAEKICTAFPETDQLLPKQKRIHTGLPIRRELLQGDRDKGLSFCGFSPDKPVLLVMGGSLGAEVINKTLRAALKPLLDTFQIVHLCGSGKLDSAYDSMAGYRQFEYVSDELPHVFASSDIILSRAGANTLFELLALKLPNLLIPLSRKASRGDQIHNARSFRNRGFSRMLEEEDLNPESLVEKLNEVYCGREKFIRTMAVEDKKDSAETVVELLETCLK